MRQLLLLLVLLPSSLASQVKILMPVVVKDASGKAVTDVKLEDFQVSGPKGIRVGDSFLVLPQTATKDDSRTAVVVIYDAVNIPTRTFELNVRDLREFLGQVASGQLPVTLLINTAAGLRLVYSARTPPEVLSAALAATSDTKGKDAAPISDPKVEEEAKNLSLLNVTSYVPHSRLDIGLNQMKSLLKLTELVKSMPERKALLWVTVAAPVGSTEQARYWNATDIHVDRGLLPMYEATVEELNASHVSVYPLLFAEGNPQQVGFQWDTWESLRQLAESTGGVAFKLGSQTSLLAATQAAMDDCGPYYMLVTEAPKPKELEWIPVKIKVNRPGVIVRAAPGYLALKPIKTN